MTLSKLLIVLSAVILFSVQVVKCQDISLVRTEMVKALASSKVTDSLYNSLDSVKNKSAIVIGYLGCLNALKAKYTWNPYNKLKYLNDAEINFKDAIAVNPLNLEIRFMRFSVECNTPSFLGYDKNIKDDSNVIIDQICKKQYDDADKTFVISTIKFLIDSKKCTLTQVQELDKQLATLI